MFSASDTIVAIPTAPVRAGIGVVRLSGPRAHAVARAILTVPHDLDPRRATLTHARGAAGGDAESQPSTLLGAAPSLSKGRIPNPESQVQAGLGRASGRPIEEVVATYFPAPHSYTSEDVVEISAHGSVALLREIVRAVIGEGARLAEPGEFTRQIEIQQRVFRGAAQPRGVSDGRHWRRDDLSRRHGGAVARFTAQPARRVQ